jgi:outer membrane cobalamin receptor
MRGPVHGVIPAIVFFVLGCGVMLVRAEDGPGPIPDSGTKAVSENVIIVTAPPIIAKNDVRNGALVTVVEQQQIVNLDAQDASNSLRMTPGVTISRFNPVGSFGGGQGGSIYIHGHGTGRPGAEITTLFDGIPRFAGVWTHPLLDTLPVEIIDHMDVYKGAQPVLFGSMGFAAVDMIPKQITQPGFSTNLNAAWGSYETAILGLNHGGKVDDFDYFLSGSHRESEGHRENADGRVNAAYGRAGWQIDPNWYTSLQVLHTDASVGDPQAVGSAPIPIKETFNTKDELYILTVANKYDAFSGFVKFYLDNGRIDWVQYDTAPFDSVSHYENYGVHLQEAFRPWRGGEFTAGFDRDNFGGRAYENHQSGIINDVSEVFYINAPHLLASQTVPLAGADVTLSAGARFYDTRFFDDGFGWKAGLKADWKETRVWAAYARTRNYPGVYAVDMFSVWPNPQGWRSLRPELLDHFEIGASQDITSWLHTDLTVFYDNVDDAIRFQVPPPRLENAGAYISRGAEATVRAEPAKGLDLFMGLTYNDTTPDGVPAAPKLAFSAGAGYKIDRWKFNVDTQFVDDHFVQNPRFAPVPTEVDSYYLINARIGYRLEDHAELYLAVENLTNKSYEFLPGYPMPGINFRIGTNVSF